MSRVDDPAETENQVFRMVDLNFYDLDANRHCYAKLVEIDEDLYVGYDVDTGESLSMFKTEYANGKFSYELTERNFRIQAYGLMRLKQAGWDAQITKMKETYYDTVPDTFHP